MATKTKIKWLDAAFKWDNAKGDSAYNKEFGRFDYTWEDVVLVESILAGGDHIDLAGIDKKKKKQLIRLVMRRRGIKMYDETKEVKNFSAHAKNIEFIIKEVKAHIKLESIDV
tara:strand:+ start:1130 stop:1468 length:339 start_codon:yes stop_codon:yes gene_type:complete